jgi:hypothetical protein
VDVRKVEQLQQDGKHDAPAEPEKGDRESNRDAPRAKLSRWALLLALALVLLGTAVWWLSSRNYDPQTMLKLKGLGYGFFFVPVNVLAYSWIAFGVLHG